MGSETKQKFEAAKADLAKAAGVSLVPKTSAKPIKFVWASEVEPRDVTFLWKPYVPLGAVTLLFGEGGIGKSWIIGSTAADLSVGRPLPGSTQALPPQKVMIISAEDDIERVIVPRLKSLDANMNNILLAGESFILDNARADDIEKALTGISAAVLFLDPLVAFTGGQMDMNRANEARTFMDRLRRIAANLEKALVVVHHTRKMQENASDMHRALGSVDFGNAIRSGLYVGTNKAGHKFLRHVKANWSEKGETLWFSTEGSEFHWQDPPEDKDPGGKFQVSTKPRKSAGQWLNEFLSGGPVLASQVLDAALKQGFSKRTLDRAKVGVARSYREGEQWYWALESEPPKIEVPVSAPVPQPQEAGPRVTVEREKPEGMSDAEWAVVQEVLSNAAARQPQG